MSDNWVNSGDGGTPVQTGVRVTEVGTGKGGTYIGNGQVISD